MWNLAETLGKIIREEGRLLRSLHQKSNITDLNNSLFAGFASAVLSLIRPEGIVYIICYPLVIIVFNKERSSLFRHFIYSVLPGTISFFGYLTFRYFYFSSFFPNTYLAKGGPDLSRLIDVLLLSEHTIQKAVEFFGLIFSGGYEIAGIAITAILIVCSFAVNRFKLFVFPAVFFLFSFFLFLVMPDDWMPEGRFTTLIYIPFYFLTAGFIQLLPKRTSYLMILFLAGCFLFNSVGRIETFASNPPIPLSEVEERSQIFERWALKMGIQRTSVGMADAGGVLLRNKLDLIDLGMLCDRVIAESLGEGVKKKDIKRFHEYVFNKRQPDFISIRAYHSWISSFDSNPVFREKYVPIREYYDGWILDRFGVKVFSGDYVRRDIAEKMPETFIEIKKEALKLKIYPFVIE